MKLVIGNKNYSSWSLRPWLLLRKSGLHFDEQRIALFSGQFKSSILSVSGAGKVPVLIDDELTVWDSLAICEYISDAYLQSEGWPVKQDDRALARSAAAEMHSGFFALREQMPMNCRATGRKVAIDAALKADIARIDELWQSLRQQYASEGPWLFGRFSIADCMYAPVALRFTTYQVDISDPSREYVETILSDPDIQAWLSDASAEPETIEIAELGKN